MPNLMGLKPYQKGTKRKRKKESDRDFLDWLRTQPSAVSGVGPCEPCHYRTAKNSGVGCKPLYSAIPMLRDEHLEQHRVGQYNFRPREWWEERVAYYVAEWEKTLDK